MTNPLLRERAVSVSFKNDWQILANQRAERRSREAHPLTCPKWLSLLNEIRTFYQTNPDE
jgi:hypothetical protein